MNKIYFIFILLFSLTVFSQNGDILGFYPNPVSNGKISITSKSNLEKDVVITDVLGKVVLSKKISNREIDISSLREGVYLIKIKEGETSVTKKLIVN